MNHHAQFMALKVNTIVPQPEPMQNLSVPLKLPKALEIGIEDFLGKAAELSKDIELEFFGQFAQLRSTHRIENNLKWAHCRSLVARTGIAPVFQP